VDLPIENGGSFHSYVTVYQRVMIFGDSEGLAGDVCGISQSFQVLRATLQVQVDLDPANALPVVYRRPMQFGHIWTMNQNGYGSIPISTIFSGMNIHKSQL